jgi:hypothetical protein
MFDNNSSVLINWFENLEERCQKLLHEKGTSWFQNALEISDIESAFNSIIRVYKSGKYYLVRTNVKNNHNNEPYIKIFNENEVTLGLEDVTTETNIISILEIQGIKFTTRNFQIEIELKQVMILNNEPIFESCLIKNSLNNKAESLVKTESVVKTESIIKTELLKQENQINDKDETLSNNLEKIETFNNLDDLDDLDNLENKDNLDNLANEIPNQTTDDVTHTNTPNNSQNNNDLESLDINFEELSIEEFNDPKELKEVELSNTLENTLETMSLKKPNEVYKVLYEKAKDKAKLAKKALIIAYLEAKKIKNTYMIENIDNSDSDFEAELDEVSESELDDL